MTSGTGPSVAVSSCEVIQVASRGIGFAGTNESEAYDDVSVVLIIEP